MLKIRDEVDLKILEKYGFSYHGEWCKTIGSFYMDYEICINYHRIICISADVPRGWDSDEGVSDNLDDIILDILYDLIRDGLIEKV